MSLRRQFLIAMPLMMIALAASPWHRALRTQSAPKPAFLVPIQFKNPQDLGVGKLLVASRGLGDPDFAKTVVLLVHYDDKGVVGLILNRRTDVPLSQVLDLKAAKGRSDPIYLGGPVAPSSVLGLLESSAKVAKAENIFGGVYLISDKTLFEHTIAAKTDPRVFHVYLGYAGWTQDQLQAETKLGAWFVFPADAATVFNPDPDTLWSQMIEKTELNLAENSPPVEDRGRPHFVGTPTGRAESTADCKERVAGGQPRNPISAKIAQIWGTLGSTTKIDFTTGSRTAGCVGSALF
jgi:putative AlgH/UPF0301 family transcriptional regulator